MPFPRLLSLRAALSSAWKTRARIKEHNRLYNEFIPHVRHSQAYKDIVFGLRRDVAHGGEPNTRVFNNGDQSLVVRLILEDGAHLCITLMKDNEEIATLSHDNATDVVLIFFPEHALAPSLPSRAKETYTAILNFHDFTEIVRYKRKRLSRAS